MSENLELFYMPYCPFCKKVTRFLKEKNIEEEVELKNINKDSEAHEKLKKTGGEDQVPCLFIDGEPMYESNDIIEWLKENKVE
ncbi:glutaredoxin family protein [Halarsenatibacter silvermanii]|uniref:Glutaredoxin n=1 Tax=Halarsenatibacter silvermanii TaxID=321763 RepID=A0A1G9NX86_9FIRM|nr:glutathione S-transferase N-terminal domain-containing protein [Halarsenatibacter silvermanii]SDL91216.1 Glutaredoxin [Halarsenatibacter silvermanii]